jgi:hypothetical protein
MQQRIHPEFSPAWFDACSVAWRLNKKRVGESWVYVCNVPNCKRIVGDEDRCKLHLHKHTMTLRSSKK